MPKLRPLPTTGALTGILEALEFFRDPNFARRRFDQLGNVFATSMLLQPMVFIQGDKAIADLLSQPEAIEVWWPKSVQQLLGRHSLANRNGAAHKARRRMVAQLFSSSALERYSPGIINLIDELGEELNTATVPLPLAKKMRRFAFSVIATTVLGLEGNDRDKLFSDFEIWTKALFSIPIDLPGSPFAKALKARKRLLEQLQEILRKPIKGKGGLDLLAGGLDETGIPFADEDLGEQLLLLLFAGYETTASALSCLMRELLLNPQIETWLREEIDTLVWPPTPEQAAIVYGPANAPRLDALVKEVMRFTPPVGGFFRRTKQSLVLDNIIVPSNRVVQVALIASNRHGIDDLDVFRPQRHLENECSLHLMPFGGGERVCLGKSLAELEIRLMVVGLFRKLQLEVVQDQDLSLRQIPSPSPRDGLLVKVKV
ncbi:MULTISPECIES: cytochrome P450 [Prochlorococcus]|uniref:cytochrome P450 n=1 Tax=Prochlorococcus TaxID=1218 RepID=UPI0005339A90|nr:MULTISPECIES: cytochrome P450 [Prochlorococcus]KGG14185.1 Cytochrome P450 enzyme [Prochlorococcus sp. MIT 0601]